MEPVKPCQQVHVKPPAVLLHELLVPQLFVPLTHSLMSTLQLGPSNLQYHAFSTHSPRMQLEVLIAVYLAGCLLPSPGCHVKGRPRGTGLLWVCTHPVPGRQLTRVLRQAFTSKGRAVLGEHGCWGCPDLASRYSTFLQTRSNVESFAA